MATKKRLSSSTVSGEAKPGAKKTVKRKSAQPSQKKVGAKSTSTRVARPRTQKTGSGPIPAESRKQEPESISPNLENSVVMTIARGAGTAVGRVLRLADKAAVTVRSVARSASRRKNPT